MKRWRTVLVVVAATVLLSSPPLLSWSNASGVHSVIALFESHVHPDIPFDKFAAGRLGIIKPTWNRSYLYVAYRYMAGPGFDPAEQKTLVSLWNDWLGLMPIPPRESDWIANMYLEILSEKAGLVRVGEAANEWLDARGKVPGVEVIDGIGIYRLAPVENTFFSFINCGDDAFHAAVGTLSSMVAKFGVSSPQVKQWVEVQDQVFDNCSDSTSDFGVNSDARSLMYDEWSKQRSKVPVPVPVAFSNACKGIRYRMATRSLDTMIRSLGASSPQVKQWVAMQDKAFEKCSEPSTYGNPPPAVVPDIPDPLTDGTPFERAQRAYQIAAANFYSGNFGTAAKMFDAIAADRSSPWRRLAPYLVARATIRKATLSAEKNDAAMLAQAEAQLNKVIATSGDKSVKHAARRLIGFVDAQLHPEQREQELARAVMMRTPGDDFRQNVSDYLWMLDHRHSYERHYSNDLTDWIAELNGFSGISANNTYDPVSTIEKWKKTSSMPWLVAAIIEIPASNSNVPVLIKAAEKVKPGSPAFATVTYHIARLLIGQGKTDQARQKLDAILAKRNRLPVSTVNELAALRMSLARNLNEFLVDAPRTTLGFTDDGDDEELPSKLDEPVAAAETPAPQATPVQIPVAGVAKAGTVSAYPSGPSMGGGITEVVPTADASSTPASTPDPVTQTLKTLAAEPLFDYDGASVLSRGLPLSVLMQAAQSQTLPHNLREQVARAAFIRAILLGDEAAARELAPAVMEADPKLKPSIDAWLAAKSPDAQRFAAAFMMLQNPGLRYSVDSGPGRITALDELDDLRDNWWGSRVGQNAENETYPSFLSPAEKKSAVEEWQKLSAINAPNFLCADAIEQAKSHPKDERAPEALYRCIRAVHLGCSNSQSPKFAQSAFVLLHHRYPNSHWAEKGKVWNKGDGACS